VLFLAVPQLIAVPISFSGTRTLIFPPHGFSLRWYGVFLSPNWLVPAYTSLVIGLVAATLATLIGGAAAVGAERGLRPTARGLVQGLLLLPLIVPVVVAAVGFYLAFARARLTDTVFGLVLAHVCLAMPLAFSVVAANVRALDPLYERAASSLGADRWRVLRRIVVPLIGPGLIVAFLFSFLTSFDEAVAALFLTGLRVTTLPRRMYEAIVQQTEPTIGVVATVSIVVALIVLVAAAPLQRRMSRTASIGRSA
jgi:putative spermidine/putrescine transport system permease protein